MTLPFTHPDLAEVLAACALFVNKDASRVNLTCVHLDRIACVAMDGHRMLVVRHDFNFPVEEIHLRITPEILRALKHKQAAAILYYGESTLEVSGTAFRGALVRNIKYPPWQKVEAKGGDCADYALNPRYVGDLHKITHNNCVNMHGAEGARAPVLITGLLAKCRRKYTYSLMACE